MSLAVGIVGAGRCGADHARAIAACEGVELAAVVDVDTGRARALAERAGCVAAATLAEVADAVDAVIVATPPATHGEQCRAALGLGKHVLCEKPFTLGAAEAEELLDEAQRTDVVLTMATKFRYVPDVVEARSRIASGTIGTVVFADCVFAAPVAMRGRWNADRSVAGGGVIADHGTHAVDLLRYLIGPLASVRADAGPRVQRVEVEDSARLSFTHRNAALSVAHLSWSVSGGLPDYLRVFGEEGIVELGWSGSLLRRGADVESFGTGYDKHRAFVAQLARFKDAVTGRAKPVCTRRDILASVRAIEAAYESLRAGGGERGIDDPELATAERGPDHRG